MEEEQRMNKRIKELAEQCGFRSNPDIYDRNQSFDVTKFAELIVRKCANLADEAEPYKAADLIKKHFGVEEQDTESNELHTCPYAEEIHHDYDTLCDCDEERTYQCARDI